MNDVIKLAAKGAALFLTEVVDKFSDALAEERYGAVWARAHKQHKGDGWSIKAIGCPLCVEETRKAALRNA